MKCQESQSLLFRYVDDDLGAEDRQALERHLAQCYDCQEDLYELQEVLALCDRALTPPPSAHRFKDLVGLLHAEPPPPMPAHSLWRDAFRMAVAAAMVLMLISTADFVVMHVRHAVQVAEQAIYAPLTADEFGQGLLGWRKRIAWAETMGDSASAPQKPVEATPPAPSDMTTTAPKGNTSWILPRNAHNHLCRVFLFDQKNDFMSFTG